MLVADLVGTAVFAVEGAIAAMRSQLDLLGVMVIAFIVALGGGVTRDVLIGATPPNAVADWDSTVVVRYGKQEDAAIGYNPQKPGRPSHLLVLLS